MKNGYPFKIEADTVETRDVDFDPDFLRHIFPRIQWHALKEATDTIAPEICLPDEVREEMLENDVFLQKLHHALLEVYVEEGALVCPETGRRFAISNGIPNLLLHEDEV